MDALGALSSEIASVVGHLIRYPTGVGQDWRFIPATPEHGHRTPADADTPILFIPGLADNKSIFAAARQALATTGRTTVGSFGYHAWDRDVRAIAARLATRVEQACADTGAARVHLVGHSLGGLIARYYVQRLGGGARVDTVVTLGTPHSGTLAAWLLAPVPLVRQLRPNSELLAELAADTPACPTRFLAISSDIDEFVLPPRRGVMEHPDLIIRNVVLSGVGHLGLPSHPQVVREVCDALGPATPLPGAGIESVAG